MASAWNRAFLIVAVASVAACKSSKPVDAQIPEAPPSGSTAGADDFGAKDPGPVVRDGGAGDAGNVAPAGHVHVVKKGDTLFSLARQYYNDPSKWRKILDANRGSISDKDHIKVGQEIVIPE